MKQTLIIWLVLVAIVLSNTGCSQKNPHTPNATIAAQYKAAVEKCLDDAVVTLQTTGDEIIAADEYVACVQAADKKYYP